MYVHILQLRYLYSGNVFLHLLVVYFVLILQSRKKTMSRYDKQVQKWRDTKKSKGATHAAKLSIAGNKMAI